MGSDSYFFSGFQVSLRELLFKIQV